MLKKKLSNKDFLELFLEGFGASTTSKKLAYDILKVFPRNLFVFEKDISSLEQIDISLPFFRKNNDFSLSFIKNTNNYPNWKEIFSSIKDINVKSKYSFVEEIWLEFDENGFDELDNCKPGFYFDVRNFKTDKINRIIELIFQLRGGSMLTAMTDKIINVLTLSDSDHIGIGLFLGRKNLPVRIGYFMPTLKAIELNKHYNIDDRITTFLKTQHLIIGEKVGVHFNITETEVDFQGIELYAREKNWGLIYDSLVKHSLCNPKLKSNILTWSDSYFRNTEIAEPLKKTEILNSYSEVLYCGINHFKIINKNLKVKVYHHIKFIDE